MKKLFLVFMFIASSYLHAQEPSSKPLKTNKQWEIGADIRWVWRDYNEGTLFFRKNFSKEEKKMAHRYGLYVSKLEGETTDLFSIYIEVGKEWQYIKDKLLIRYGIDVPFSWSHFYDTNPATKSTNAIQTGLSPFLGASYPITKGVFISWSTALRATYRLQRNG